MTISDGNWKGRLLVRVFVLALAAMQGSAWAEAAFRFENVTAPTLDRAMNSDYRFDAVFTDFNSDGCYDLFVFGHADPGTSRLWVNRCDGSNTFTFAANDQVHHYIPNPTSPLGAGWITLLDVNGDGRQDFWLRHASTMAARYINGTAAGSHIPFFLDKEDGCDDFCVFGDITGEDTLDVIRYNRTVERITDRQVLMPAAGTPGIRMVGDINGDSWPDLMQAESGGYWQNDHGTLSWQARPALHANEEPMAMADFDNSGSLDLITLDGNDDSGQGHYNLFRNDGSGNFTDVTAGSGLDQLPFTAWFSSYGNIVTADFDNDGLPDILVAGADYSSSVILLHNLGNLRFERVDVDLGSAGDGSESAKARAAVADFDNDGRLDIIKTQANTNVGLWRNVGSGASGHWMKARVRGAGLNTDGIGTDLTWYAPGTTTRIAHMTVQANGQHAQTWVHTGLASHTTADLVVRYPHDGPTYHFDAIAADQEVIVYPNGCLVQNWKPGHGWPLRAPADCATRGARERPVRGHSTHPRPCAGKDAELPKKQRIELHRNGANGETAAVTLGIPFAPGQLTDAKQLRIVDASGSEVPAHIEPTLRWHFKDGSIRAVRAQFHAPLKGDTATLYFALDQPRTADAPAWSYADGLVDGEGGMRVPGVLATLSPEWMSESLIAGPQQAAVPATAYDKYVARQFEWAKKLPTGESSAWLFDRTTTLYKQYVRTGRFDYLQAAVASYRFYMSHLRRTGPPFHPFCGGGWEFDGVNPCDVKYVYIEPILLSLALSGDDSQHDAALVRRMVDLWDAGGWTGILGPYEKTDQLYTERNTGLGLLAVVSAYELTGDAHYRKDIEDRVGWLQKHQQTNPDGQPADGSWRHSWQRHEGDEYNAATDVRGASPWMSENIIDGLWHAWVVTEDKRIPGMLTAFGHYLEKYGWIDPAMFAKAGHSWRNGCSGPDGQIAWYWSSSLATPEQLIKIQDSEGWYSDQHDVELGLAVAAARYFETDPAQQKALDRRLVLIANSYSPACAEGAATARRFNWNNRGAGVVQWFLRQKDGPAPSSAASTKAGMR